MRLDQDAEHLLQLMATRPVPDIRACTPAQLRSWYSDMPVMPGPEPHAIRDLMAGEIPARLYLPSASPGLPLLVWLHGGGWVIGDLRSADWVCRALCAQAGTAVLSVDYRLAPEHPFPAAPEDAYAAIVWAVAHAAELGVDPARVAVGGDSAGGGLAAACCLMAKARGGPALSGQLLVYPGTDHDLGRPSATAFADGPVLTRDAMLWFQGHYLPPGTDRSDPRASPALAPDHTALPPAFVATAEIDPIRDAGEAYAAILAQAGVLTTAKRYRGVFHGFFTMGEAMAKTREAVADAARFLRTL